MELERRETALDRGFTSLYDYCVKNLGYSEGAAFLRIRAARAAAEFPDVLERLRSGKLHLDAIARLYPHLTADNSTRLLARVDGASKTEVLALVATLKTEPPPERDVIAPVAPIRAVVNDATDSSPNAGPDVIPPPQHRFHFTGDGQLLSLVTRLRGLLRHKYPGGLLADIFRDAASALLEKIERDRLPNSKPMNRRQAGSVPKGQRLGSRIVPKRVKREVWARDDGRCAFIALDGRRCESRDALEYDHIIPWADGGRSDTPANIRLLCRAHNHRLGRKRFGPRPQDR